MGRGKLGLTSAGLLPAGFVGCGSAEAQPVQLKLGLWGQPSSYFYVDAIEPWA